MSAVSNVLNFSVSTAIRDILKSGIGLGVLAVVGPSVLDFFNSSPMDMLGFAIQALVLTVGLWVGNVFTTALLG